MGKLLISIKTLLCFFILLLLLNIKKASSQSFDIPRNFLEAPLIYPYESSLKGISKILPVTGLFSRYSYIELSIVENNIQEIYPWLKDKLFDELGDIAEIERLLRSDDSPLSDPIFDQFKNIPLHINDTLEQLAINPVSFCNDIVKLYNVEGLFYELNCTIPFGFFNKYLILRLQSNKEVWYFTKITSLSYKRIKVLTDIAETFRGK